MELTMKLKEASGYQWVMDALSPAGPFGRRLARDPRWYGPEDRAELEGELDLIEGAMALSEDAVHEIGLALAALQDISGSLDRPQGSAMDDVELFQVKGFLLGLERLVRAADGLSPLVPLVPRPMTGLLDILDPDGRRLPPFSPARFDPHLLDLPQSEREDRERVIRLRLTGQVLAHKADFSHNFDRIGHLDLVLAKARLARRYGCVRPTLGGDALTAQELFHPKVAALLADRGRSFTPLTLEAPKGATVITGANMGGKSVALSAVTLAVLLAHTGFFVFARRFATPLFRSAALIAGDGSSVEGGLSSFGAEVTAVDTLLKTKGPFFAAIDEFARGTNPQEGARFAGALAAHLSGLDCVALMTTHYDGVSGRAAAHYQVAGLDENAPGDTLSQKMDYRLLPAPPGAPCPKDGGKVCRLLGISRELAEILGEND